MNTLHIRRLAAAAALALGLAAGARAQSTVSDASALSMLPIAVSVAAGTAVVVTAISTGWVLSAASEAIAFIPNELGAALLYNERITR